MEMSDPSVMPLHHEAQARLSFPQSFPSTAAVDAGIKVKHGETRNCAHLWCDLSVKGVILDLGYLLFFHKNLEDV